jgi:DNA-binding Xre family transcriptional regulator
MNHLFYLLSDPMLIIEIKESRLYIRDVNQAFTEFSGFKKSDLLHLDPSSAISTADTGSSFYDVIHSLSEDEWSSPSIECALVTKSSTPAPIRLSSRKLQSDGLTFYVLICKDLRETKWIDDYIVQNKIMISTIVDDKYNIKTLKHYYAPVQEPSSSYIGTSIYDMVLEHDRSKAKRVFEYAKNNRTAEKIDFQLKLGDRSYSTSALIQPFYNGNRSFKNFVVILMNMQLSSQEEDPSYKLRMLMLSKNVSVTSLAQSTLISLTTISKIRNGKIKKPQRLTAELIAGELGVRPEMIWSNFKR